MPLTLTKVNHGVSPGDGAGDYAFYAFQDVNTTFDAVKVFVDGLETDLSTHAHAWADLPDIGSYHIMVNESPIAAAASSQRIDLLANNVSPVAGDIFLGCASTGSLQRYTFATLEAAWSIAWSKVTSTPTTMSGYGISDTKANFNAACSDGTFLFVGDVSQYTLPLASSFVRGGVQIGYTENGKNYPVELSAEKMFVNVPWTDTVYSLPLATSTVRGGIELFSNTDNPTAANSVSSTASRTYGLQLNAANQGVVNVPWVNTVYTHPTTAGNKHIPAAGAAGQWLKWSAAGTAAWADLSWNKNITIESPVSGDDITWFFTPVAIRFTEIRLVAMSGGSPSCVVTIRHSTNRSLAGTIVDTNTVTSSTTGHDVTAISDPTIPANSFVWIEIGTTTAGTTEVHITGHGTID